MGKLSLRPEYCFDNANIMFQGNNVLVQYKAGHTHNHYEFFLIERGNALHTANKQSFVVEAGDLTLIRPDDEHCFSVYKTQDFKMINVPVSEVDFFDVVSFLRLDLSTLTMSALPPTIRLNKDQLAWFSQRLVSINALPIGSLRGAYMRHIFIEVLLELLETKKAPDALPVWLAETLRQLEKSIDTPGRFATILDNSGKSKEHFCRVFKKHFNMTPTKYCGILRIRRAGELLQTTTLSIQEICHKTGFERQNYFYKCFEEYFHVTPREYRNRNAKKYM